MILSSNFAEARPNHFHSGIDIKTGGEEGHRIVAVKDGYVSRIAVKPYGYGRVVYLTHNDGTTSVYAHISRFIPKLESYIRTMRYETQTNDVELYPDKDMFQFKAGEQIAFSGNSGSSGGPHLHFEIRDSRTQNTINILSTGIYDVEDNIPPTIVALHFFAVDTIDGVPVEKKIKTLVPVKAGPNDYCFSSPVKLPCKGFFVLETTDRKDGTQNTMGVYNIIEWVDGTPVYQMSLDEFSFAETRSVNSLTIYGMQKKSRNEIFRLSRQQNCNFSGLRIKSRDGVIDPSQSDSVRIEVLDDAGNMSLLAFAVKADSLSEKPQFMISEFASKVISGMPKTFSKDQFSVTIAEKSLFATSYVEIEKIDTTGLKTKALSEIFRLDSESVPYFSPVTISIRSGSAIEKGMVMARYNPSTHGLSSIGGRVSGNSITATTSAGGYFCLACDTIAPKITPALPKNFSWTSSKSVKFKMADNFSGVSSYSLSIDGKFAILEHIMKQSTLVHFFDDKVFGTGKNHKLVLTIVDGAGNRAVYTKTYTR